MYHRTACFLLFQRTHASQTIQIDSSRATRSNTHYRCHPLPLLHNLDHRHCEWPQDETIFWPHEPHLIYFQREVANTLCASQRSLKLRQFHSILWDNSSEQSQVRSTAKAELYRGSYRWRKKRLEAEKNLFKQHKGFCRDQCSGSYCCCSTTSEKGYYLPGPNEISWLLLTVCLKIIQRT